MAQKPGAPRRVTTFNQWVLATGGRPLLRVGEPRLLAGRFDVSVTLTDNAVVAADLGLASVWDKQVQGLYGSAAAKLEAGFRLAAVRLYINDPAFTLETQALKADLDNRAYIHIIRSANTADIPLRNHIYQPQTMPAGLTTAQLALTEDRALYKGRPRKLARPFQLDLKTDTIQLNIDTAINWAAAAGIAAHVQLWGHIGPRDYAGTMVSDSDVCSEDLNAQAASADPALFSDYSQAGFGGALMDIPMQESLG